MEGISTACPVEPASRSWMRWLNVLALSVVWLWHGWMILQLFGPIHPWDELTNDQPILSGRHPLHLYHGFLGARSFWDTGSFDCYDPAFQAGYPKTPVYDSGSRPAEMFLALAGGDFSPRAYKIGFAFCCLAAPGFLIFAARMMGLSRTSSLLATIAGLLVWWSMPGRELLENGDLEVLLAGLCALAGSTLLLRFHCSPGFWVWVGVATCGTLGWFAQPFVLMLLFPVLLVYYLSVGNRHRWFWHVSLLVALGLPLVFNEFWLTSLFTHWWIRSPLSLEVPLLEHRTIRALWEAPLWGETPDRILAWMLLGSAAGGIVILNETRQRAAARLLGLGSAGFLILAILGVAWDPLGRLGTPKLLVPALWFAILPAGYAITHLVERLALWLGRPRWQIASCGGAFFLILLVLTGHFREFVTRALAPQALQVGLDAREQILVETLSDRTTAEARILWEGCSRCPSGSQWMALLPIWTGRAYLGALDPETSLEHTQACLMNGVLAGRPLEEWSDLDLEDFCRRYNLGWLVAWSQESHSRFGSWSAAKLLASGLGDGSVSLYQLLPGSFVLKGQATIQKADHHSITLTDVVPDNGVVVLSMHYQSGLHVSPSRAKLEKEPNPCDPIPFIRLRLAEPLARVTLMWEEP